VLQVTHRHAQCSDTHEFGFYWRLGGTADLCILRVIDTLGMCTICELQLLPPFVQLDSEKCSEIFWGEVGSCHWAEKIAMLFFGITIGVFHNWSDRGKMGGCHWAESIALLFFGIRIEAKVFILYFFQWEEVIAIGPRNLWFIDMTVNGLEPMTGQQVPGRQGFSGEGEAVAAQPKKS